MLFNVKASTISQNNQIVTIQVTLKNGLQGVLFMLLKKQVRGGVLLYALFYGWHFTLLLHVYLERVVASSRQNQAQMTSSQSRLMAEMTMDLADKEAGAFSFSQGTRLMRLRTNK